MKRYILIVAAMLLSGTAFAQTPPVAGGGCTPGTHTFCVLTTADSGTGSLRQAITDSNTAGGANTIGFAIPTNPLTPTPQTGEPASGDRPQWQHHRPDHRRYQPARQRTEYERAGSGRTQHQTDDRDHRHQ